MAARVYAPASPAAVSVAADGVVLGGALVAMGITLLQERLRRFRRVVTTV